MLGNCSWAGVPGGSSEPQLWQRIIWILWLIKSRGECDIIPVQRTILGIAALPLAWFGLSFLCCQIGMSSETAGHSLRLLARWNPCDENLTFSLHTSALAWAGPGQSWTGTRGQRWYLDIFITPGGVKQSLAGLRHHLSFLSRHLETQRFETVRHYVL